jgi:hypothetical protein
MDKVYEPGAIESRWYREWEQRGYFAPADTGTPYCIMIPPPNVTGTLHMGHAFQDTIMDALVRHHRMRGHATLWQVGTDHAGIATQMVVERQLNAAGQSRTDLGREAFVKRVWEWKAQSGGTITSSCAASAPRWTGRASASRWTSSCRARSPKCSCACTKKASSIAASAWSTGIRCCSPRCRTSRCSRRRKTVTCGTCATRWKTAAAIWSWPPRAPRRCSAIPPWPCIPRTSATGI